ncbi:hypothetical protein PUR34_28310 [Streptomyces sp. JV185]|uniref:hypothetical protein n=1 Tax=Streptomyces sp. JV185 TaxID=858638 RepID=UPI002E794465|nr:hypothetical protein [Streptomyces sp. JV185]MEE1771953.1 hypothetical protein [Streptomyces sp. JV185]
MQRRQLVTAISAALLLSACGSSNGSDSVEEAKKGARNAVESYVDALNSRDADHLIEVGGVPDDPRARREAGRILADKGGRGLSITQVQIDLDMGPEAGSAKLTAKEKSGRTTQDSFSVVRVHGTWHLTVFTDRPVPSGKSTSSTE